MHKIIFFSRKPEKILGFKSKFWVGLDYPKHRYFFIWPNYRDIEGAYLTVEMKRLASTCKFGT